MAALALVLLLAALTYRMTLAAPFVYEDAQWLAARPTWQVPGRPLAAWTFQQAGTPEAAHALNLGLHLANGVLVYVVAATLVGPVALIAATLFLLHPLNSEAVAYASARGDLLLTLGTLLAVAAALRLKTWRGLVLMGAGVVIAALSKEIGLIAVPLVALTVAQWRRLPFVSILPLAALTMVLAVQFPLVWSWATMQDAGAAHVDTATFLRIQMTQVWRLLALVVWPAGLTIDHDAWMYGQAWRLLAATGTTAAGVFGLVAWHRAWRLTAWTLAWVAISVAPRFLFQTNEWIHEYQLYPAMAGLCVGVAGAIGVVIAAVPQARLQPA